MREILDLPLVRLNYRPHPNVFSLSTPGGGQVQLAGGGSGPAGGGGVRSSQGGSGPAGRGGQVQPRGGGKVQLGGPASCTLLRAVCLLRSRRRTFLFYNIFSILTFKLKINLQFVFIVLKQKNLSNSCINRASPRFCTGLRVEIW